MPEEKVIEAEAVETESLPVAQEKPYAIQLLEHGVSTDKLAELMAIQKEVEAMEARKAFFADMANAQAEMPTAPEDQYNDQTRSRYSSYKALAAACKPVYTRHGISMIFYEGDSPKEDEIRVCVDITHRMGHTATYHADIPLDAAGIKGQINKTRPHAKGSSFSYGRSYLMRLVWNMPTGDDDDGQAAGVEFISDEQAKELEALANEARGGYHALMKFLSGFKPPIEAISTIPVSQYDFILGEVKKRLPE